MVGSWEVDSGEAVRVNQLDGWSLVEMAISGEQLDLLASRFVKGSYCAYSFVLTVVITGIGQLIATLVLEPCRAAARHRSEMRTVRSERSLQN